MAEYTFNKLPNFRPHFSPFEILNQGAFGGTFFNKVSLRKYLPEEILMELRLIDEAKWNSQEYNSAINKFPVEANVKIKNYEVPEQIRVLHKAGWFQWYVDFFYNFSPGPADMYRYRQWVQGVRDMMFYVKKYCGQEGKPITDLTVEPALKYRQQVFQLGWDSTINPDGLIK